MKYTGRERRVGKRAVNGPPPVLSYPEVITELHSHVCNDR